MHSELFRREADNNDKKDGSFNQFDEGPEVASDEQAWVDVWHQDSGWIQALAPAAKRPRPADEDETPPDSKVRRDNGKGDKGCNGCGKNGKGKGKGLCFQCGSPGHYQRDCPKGTGKPSVLPAAWFSWRPSPSWSAPTPSQWRAWMPKPAKGQSKGNGTPLKVSKEKCGKAMQVDGDAGYA